MKTLRESEFSDYLRMVAQLKKPALDILESLDEGQCDLLHMVIGLTGEVGELLEARTTDHIKEELGDALFYLVGTHHTLWMYYGGPDIPSFELPSEVNKHNILVNLVAEATNALDLVKKHVIYNKDLNLEALQKSLGTVGRFLQGYAEYNCIELNEILRHNAYKLTKGKNARYASGSYSDQQAQDRADKQEGE